VKVSKDGHKTTISYEMVDYFDDQYNVTSMARTMAFPASIVPLAKEEVDQKGVVPPELVFRGKRTGKFLRCRGFPEVVHPVCQLLGAMLGPSSSYAQLNTLPQAAGS